MLAGIQGVIDPAVFHPSPERHRDVKGQGLLVVPLIIVTLVVLGVLAQAVVDAVADPVPAGVIPDADGGHALLAVPVILVNQAQGQ
ncbi:hypothetical protein D3C75_1024800 [compost metagenome]